VTGQFRVDQELLAQARARLSGRASLFWVLGGAGAGKSTVCAYLSAKYDIPVYRMDDYIYGEYHGKFLPARHPANYAWSTAPDPLAWLLNLAWEEFDAFNRAALPEYLDLFAEELVCAQDAPLLVDGGLCNPVLLVQAVPASQVVCLAMPTLTSEAIWESSQARRAMKEMIYQRPDGERLWQTFLGFDREITNTLLRESKMCGIHVCARRATEPVADFAERVAQTLGIGTARPPISAL
jgi:hypothetical protein